VNLAVIINPSAGGGRAARELPAVRRTLTELALEHRVERTRSLEHARELATEATARGEVAVAFGGDGLIGVVAGALASAGSGVLGILPGGRGNDFARALGIPLTPVEACAVLAHGVERPLDLGEANGRVFAGIASCGFDSEANRIANDTRLVRGNLVYAYGALRALAAWQPARFTLTVDDRPARMVVGYTIAAANSKAYGGGMLMAPDALLTDGLLELVVVGAMGKVRFLRGLPDVFKGQHVNHPEVEVVRCAAVEISADRPFTMYADGDPIAELPVQVRALPGAVRALTPG
jgi:YegS/Rv2252/BmrU family lipid kinase